MAYSYVWPATLPGPQKGFTETGGVLVIRSPMDKGPAKIRKRGAKSSVLSLTFLMTETQVTTLENFIQNTIKGTARFGFTHPRKNTTVETRIVPQSEGEMYNLTYAAPGFYNVSLQLEILP